MLKRTVRTPGPVPAFRKTKIAAAIAAVSGLYAVPVAGEDAGAQPTVEEIIVTARKREQNIQDTPVSIQAFTSDDIDEARHQPLRGLRGPERVDLLHQRGPRDAGHAHPRRVGRRYSARVPHQRRDHGLLPRRAAGDRPQRGGARPAPLRHRAHRGAARTGGHLLRRVRRVRNRAHHQQAARPGEVRVRRGPDGRQHQRRRHHLHRRGLRQRAAVRPSRAAGRVLVRQEQRLHRQPAFRVHVPQRRHRQQRPLRRRGLQRGRDPGWPGVAARRPHRQLDRDGVGIHAVPGRGGLVEPRPDPARGPRGHPFRPGMAGGRQRPARIHALRRDRDRRPDLRGVLLRPPGLRGERLLGLRGVRLVRRVDPAARLRGLLLVRLHGLRRPQGAFRQRGQQQPHQPRDSLDLEGRHGEPAELARRRVPGEELGERAHVLAHAAHQLRERSRGGLHARRRGGSAAERMVELSGLEVRGLQHGLFRGRVLGLHGPPDHVRRNAPLPLGGRRRLGLELRLPMGVEGHVLAQRRGAGGQGADLQVQRSLRRVRGPAGLFRLRRGRPPGPSATRT